MKKSSNEVKVEESLTATYWRGKFDDLLKKTDEMGLEWSRRSLVFYDNYFLAATGKDAVRNVREGRGGLEPTMRVVKALQKLIDSKSDEEGKSVNRAKRQKLVLP